MTQPSDMPWYEEDRLDAALEELAARRARQLHPSDDDRQLCASVVIYRRLLCEYLS